MKNKIFFFFLLLVACNQSNPTNTTNNTPSKMAKQYPTTGSIERLDSAIDQLIAKEAKIEVLADGFTWSELSLIHI